MRPRGTLRRKLTTFSSLSIALRTMTIIMKGLLIFAMENGDEDVV